MVPPSATCWSSWPETPNRNTFDLNRSGSISAALPSRLRRTSHQANEPSATAPTASSAATASPPSCQTRIPRTMPPMPRTDRSAADRVDLPGARVRHVLHEPDAGQDDDDDHDLAGEGEPPRQVGRDEAADQRADGRRDRRRRTDERVDLALGRALEVAVDQRLHRRQEERRAEPADDRPEDDDRREALGDRHRRGADRVGRAGRRCTPACARTGRRSCCRSG